MIITRSIQCARNLSFRKFSTTSIFRQKERVHRERHNVQIPDDVQIRGKTFETDQKQYNLTKHLLQLVERGGMHKDPLHPIGLLSACIQQHFNSTYKKNTRTPLFTIMTDIHPVVTTHQQFDSMLIPKDHISRSKTDNYYVNENLVLRAHTSAHQEELMKQGLDNFLVFGDVYRRDEIDRTHYPAFHQLEGVKLFNNADLPFEKLVGISTTAGEAHIRTETSQTGYSQMDTDFIVEDMQNTLIHLVKKLLGDDLLEYRWNSDYFPFTHPSYELEILYNDQWVEILGCGVIEQQILDNCTVSNKKGWAFGIGLERLAMLMFKIKDIRMLWTNDELAKKSYQNLISNLYRDMGVDTSNLEEINGLNSIPNLKIDQVKKLSMPQNYSKVPAIVQHLSFFKIDENINQNDIFDLIREEAGELIESVTLQDTFFHPKKKMESNLFEMIFRPVGDRALSHSEVNVVTDRIKERLLDEFEIEKRW